jgi:TRAP-type C4-dicarboxylate transport system permease small subunit
MMAGLLALDRFVGALCKWGVIIALVALFVLLLLAVIVRMAPVIPISGYDEIVEWLFAWLTFLGALALWREGALYRVTLVDALPMLARRVVEFAIQSLMLLFAVVLMIYGVDFLRNAGETTPFLGIDKSWWYAAMPVTGALMTIYSIVGLWRAVTGRLLAPDTGPLLG